MLPPHRQGVAIRGLTSACGAVAPGGDEAVEGGFRHRVMDAISAWHLRACPKAGAKTRFRDEADALTQQLSEYVYNLFESNVDIVLKYLRAGASRELVPTVNAQLIDSLCALFISLMPKAKLNLDPAAFDATCKVLQSMFYFSLIWSMGASIEEGHWPTFDEMLRDQINAANVKFPGGGDVHDYYVDLPDATFKPWKEIVPEFVYDPKASYFDMLVPTVDTVRYAFIFERSVDVMKPVLFTGHSGVGKSVVIADTNR